MISRHTFFCRSLGFYLKEGYLSAYDVLIFGMKLLCSRLINGVRY